MDETIDRDELALRYLEELPFEPYPVQEEALLGWFSSAEGVLVCAPTGTGKTLIAEAVLFEALHRGEVAYYTTPLIALTEQKYQEITEAAVRWGFSEADVGLVTGNRKVNPEAKILVVVAEILLNRLLDAEHHHFESTFAVVMDEFHSFNDPERGAVWELTLGLLPKHVRLMLLSATVGNAIDFLSWLRQQHDRKLRLIQSDHRRVPLNFRWIPDQLLDEQLEIMASGDEQTNYVPALVFCFNRSQCWSIAEQLKGKRLISKEHQKVLGARLDQYDWSTGAGPKLKPILLRGIGVHHAGVLPKYRRIVEELFQEKLLSVCMCTETLAAGINLPARSVLLISLLKGPPGKMKLIDASSAHQMFGRAGRPQYDTEGYVFSIPDEDDVKILRWKERYDQIPEDTKDPQLIKAKKRLKKKMPTRNSKKQYWNEDQFQKLREAPSANLASRGHLPWRMLAWLIQNSADVNRLQQFVQRRMLFGKAKEQAVKQLHKMLITLWHAGVVTLEPAPPVSESTHEPQDKQEMKSENTTEQSLGLFGQILQEAIADENPVTSASQNTRDANSSLQTQNDIYQPERVFPTDRLQQFLQFRSVNPVFACYLLQHLGAADEFEQMQLLESVLEVPGSMARDVRIPIDFLVSGPLAQTSVDAELIEQGLLPSHRIWTETPEDPQGIFYEDYPPPIAEKLLMLFRTEYPGVHGLRITPVWIAGDLLKFGGDFQKFVSGRDLTKQEGIVFRHLLRFVLLIKEFLPHCPAGIDQVEWQSRLLFWEETISEACREVDPVTTQKTLQNSES